jgi:hypothetical protein
MHRKFICETVVRRKRQAFVGRLGNLGAKRVRFTFGTSQVDPHAATTGEKILVRDALCPGSGAFLVGPDSS